MRTVDVTFPVTLRLALDEATSLHSLEAVRGDLERLVHYAADPDATATEQERKRPVARYTPVDHGTGTFHVAVGKPTVELPELLYEDSQGDGVVLDLAAER